MNMLNWTEIIHVFIERNIFLKVYAQVLTVRGCCGAGSSQPANISAPFQPIVPSSPLNGLHDSSGTSCDEITGAASALPARRK